MAFGIERQQLLAWKDAVRQGKRVVFLTHYWIDDRFPQARTVTKAGCADIERLQSWGEQYGLKRSWIDLHPLYPHYDLLGTYERTVLEREGLLHQWLQFYPNEKHL